MTFIGLFIGILYGLISGVLLITLLAPVAILPVFLAPLLILINPIAGLFSAMPIGLSFLIWYFFNILIFWLLSIPAQSSTGLTSTASVSPINTIPIPPTGMQNFYRGFGFGTAGVINFAIFSPFLALIPILILAIASILPIFSVFSSIRRNTFYQGLMLWMNWLLPIHWFGNLVGFVVFLVFRTIGLFSGTTAGIRLDLTSGVIESRAPAPVTAFNIAVFTYIGPSYTPGPFLSDNVSSHEVGHATNSAAMTPFYTWGTVIEEFRIFGTAHNYSIGQQTAESRGVPRAGTLYSALWST